MKFKNQFIYLSVSGLLKMFREWSKSYFDRLVKTFLRQKFLKKIIFLRGFSLKNLQTPIICTAKLPLMIAVFSERAFYSLPAPKAQVKLNTFFLVTF